MNARCLLALLLLPVAARADETALFTLETFSVPAATWVKIPTAMRDDHALLRTTLLGQLPKGEIALRDRLGGSGRSRQKLAFSSESEVLVPSAFGSTDAGLFPTAWETWKVGSEVELNTNFATSGTLIYRLAAPDPPLRPLLTSGKRLDVARTSLPMFPILRLDTDIPVTPVCLVAVAPDPNRQQRERRLLVCFLVMSGLPENGEAARREPAYALELLGLRGRARTGEVPAPELVKNLLRRSDALAFALTTTQVPGPRITVEAVQEYPHPGHAEQGPAGPVPTRVETVPIGTTMNAQLAAVADGKVGALIQIDHNWREPVLPSIPGKDGEPMDRSLLPHKMQLRVRDDIVPGAWVLLAEQPLSDVFGPDDRDTKGESCYLFGRLVIIEAGSTR